MAVLFYSKSRRLCCLFLRTLGLSIKLVDLVGYCIFLTKPEVLFEGDAFVGYFGGCLAFAAGRSYIFWWERTRRYIILDVIDFDLHETVTDRSTWMNLLLQIYYWPRKLAIKLNQNVLADGSAHKLIICLNQYCYGKRESIELFIKKKCINRATWSRR